MKCIQGSLCLRVVNQSLIPCILPLQTELASKLFRLCLPVNFLFPKKEESYSSLCSPRRAECSAAPALALPNPERALMSQPYCGLVVLWLQFTEQDGSSRQDKNKVKCSQGSTADLGKLLQLKLICCLAPLCHLCITVPLGCRMMLCLGQVEGA